MPREYDLCLRISMMKSIYGQLVAFLLLFSASFSPAANMTDELICEYAIGQVATEIDQVLRDIIDTYAPNENARNNIRTIQDNKGTKAFFNRIDDKTKLTTTPFVVRVTSDYFDESLKKWVTVTGMGTVIHNGSKLLLVSASHVTQGKNLKIFRDDGFIYNFLEGKRLANVEQDLEVLELDNKNGSSHLFYDSSIGKIRSVEYDLTEKWSQVPGLRDNAKFIVSMNQHVAVMLKGFVNLPNAMGGFGQFEALEMSDLRGKTIEDKAAYVWDRMGNIAKPLFGSGWISISKMPPGLSGAPLIRDVPTFAAMKTGKYFFQLDGLVLAQHRTQKKTFYADSDQIVNLIRRMDKGERGYVNAARWRMSGGLTFRDYGNGLLETILTTRPSANCLVQDSGNAVSVDSGNAVSVDSGNAVSVDSGKGSKVQVQVFLGNQVKQGQNVLGRWIEKDGEKTPVISLPYIEKEVFKLGYTLGGVINDKADLYKLAQAKAEFRNSKQYMSMNLQCYFSLDEEKGLTVDLFEGQEVERQGFRGVGKRALEGFHFTRDQLRKGFSANKLLIKKGANTYDLTGMFITDLNSAIAISGVEAIKGPSVAVQLGQVNLMNNQINCFKSYDARLYMLRSFIDDYVEKAHRNMGTFYGVP